VDVLDDYKYRGVGGMAMYSWIRKEREARRLSQSKLSQLTGIAQVYLSAWEHKKSEPSEAQNSRIREAFGKYDAMVASGEHVKFLTKTRWSADHHGTRRVSPSRNRISLEEIERFVNSACHSLKSPRRFTKNRELELRYNGLSLFSGCGGLAMGFHEAGVRIVGHVEIDDAARAVFEKNFPASLGLGHDIGSIDTGALSLQRAHLPKIDIIFGGPPCQGFSLTGKRDVYDPRNQLYKDYARFVDAFRPAVFVLENVRLLTSMKTPSGSLLIDDILQTFKNLNYEMSFAELNALNYGVPQSRERTFVIGIDRSVWANERVTFPPPSHGYNEPSLFAPALHTPLTLRDAISDLEYLESGEKSEIDPFHFAVSHPSHVIEMLRGVPEGESAHDNPDPRLRPRSGYNTTYKRLRWDEPASTISTTFGMISGSRNVHPTATRSLTIREALRCQTFPDNFLIFGQIGAIRTMIGNAVPPRLAAAIAEHVVQTYFSTRKSPGVGQMIEISSL
jgi:DNA (cytosine-5)-methyltransferase 1